MKLSFGMIFSIILIIVFIAFAFYAIQKFLELQRSAQIGLFVNDLQSDVDKMWISSGGSEKEEYILPKKIDSICFKNDEYENLVLYSSKKEFMEGRKIKNIDIEEITKDENPFCIRNVDGKIKMTIKKDSGEPLVVITRQNE